jgi:hypothetical protein
MRLVSDQHTYTLELTRLELEVIESSLVLARDNAALVTSSEVREKRADMVSWIDILLRKAEKPH